MPTRKSQRNQGNIGDQSTEAASSAASAPLKTLEAVAAEAGNDNQPNLKESFAAARNNEPVDVIIHRKKTLEAIRPYLPQLEAAFNVTIARSGHKMSVEGSDKSAQDKAAQVLRDLNRHSKTGGELTQEGFHTIVSRNLADPSANSNFGLPLQPRNDHQREYLQAMMASDTVVGTGPAGTGKSFLAMAVALYMFQTKQVKKIYLTRPAVGEEELGFLPGDLNDKVGPFMIPLMDAAEKILGSSVRLKELIEKDIIQFVPFAVMRGRNFDDAFVILDEAQNTTPNQMKMFLTRMGKGSRMVIDGDATQCDLIDGRGNPLPSGLNDFLQIVDDTTIPVVAFDESDVVRSARVKEIVAAYAKRDNARLQEATDAAKAQYARNLPPQGRARGPQPR